MHQGYQKVGGFPKTVMGTVLAGLVYGLALQATYYTLALIAFMISLQGALGLKSLKAYLAESDETESVTPLKP